MKKYGKWNIVSNHQRAEEMLSFYSLPGKHRSDNDELGVGDALCFIKELFVLQKQRNVIYTSSELLQKEFKLLITSYKKL